MKVLVMGGTQFNGRALVKELCKHGHGVTVLNRGKTAAELPHGVRRLLADRTDPGSVRAALGSEEFDCVQDMTAYRLEDAQLMTEILRGRTGHYVFASSTVIYAATDLPPIAEDGALERGERQNEYGLGKIAIEDHLLREHRERGFPASIAAFSMVFGPHNILPDREQRMFIRLLRGRPVLVPGDGTTLGQVGHVDDEARALRMMMGNPLTFGKRYNLTGAGCFSDEGYIDTFADLLGVEPRKVFIPPALMDDLYAGKVRVGGSLQVRIDTRTGRSGGGGGSDRAATLFLLQRIIQRIAPHIHHWNRSVFFSIEHLKRDTGWEPEYTFPAAVEQTWAWMRAEGLHETAQFDFDFEDDLLERIHTEYGQ